MTPTSLSFWLRPWLY
uniref:Uncharacterized protein n=1 Tax=Nymphaea colorata TaxID=210225 RepID=A0A5K0WLU7_9MAGN